MGNGPDRGGAITERQPWLRGRGVAAALAASAIACGGGGEAPPPDAPLDEAPAAPSYMVYVTNEYAGDLTVIDGATNEVVNTIPLGKRPRGVKVSPDGTHLFVALSGSPPSPPGTDESTLPPPDRSADGIGVVDLAAGEMVTMVRAGTDPEQMAVTNDGARLYVANEDAGAASVVDIATGEILAEVPVGGEPEGVRISPDGSVVYITSEEDNQVTAIDTATNEAICAVRGGRPPPRQCVLPGQQPRLCDRREQRHRPCGGHGDARRCSTPSSLPTSAIWSVPWASLSPPTGPASTSPPAAAAPSSPSMPPPGSR